MLLLHLFPLLVLQRTISSSWVPLLLWTYLQEPLEPDSFVQLFHLNHQYYAKTWEVRHLDKFTIFSFISEEESIQLKQIRSHSIMLNFLKITILQKYGGVWVDYFTIFTEDLKWVWDMNQRKNIERYQTGSEISFIFFKSGHISTSQCRSDEKNVHNISQEYIFQFVASSANSPFISQFYLYCSKRFKQKQQNNQTLSQLVELFLQSVCQNEKRRRKSQIENHYKILSLNPKDGPLLFHINFEDTQIHYLMRYPSSYFHNLKQQIRYFIYLSDKDVALMGKYLQQSGYGGSYKQRMTEIIEKNDFQNIDKIFCPQRYLIHQSSIVSLYLLSRNKYFYDSIKKLQRSQHFQPFDGNCSELQIFIQELSNRQELLASLGFSLKNNSHLNNSQQNLKQKNVVQKEEQEKRQTKLKTLSRLQKKLKQQKIKKDRINQKIKDNELEISDIQSNISRLFNSKEVQSITILGLSSKLKKQKKLNKAIQQDHQFMNSALLLLLLIIFSQIIIITGIKIYASRKIKNSKNATHPLQTQKSKTQSQLQKQENFSDFS